MIYPGYLLNPGDMFQVDPTMVLHRTGTILLPTKQERHLLREQAAKAKKAAKAVEGRAAEKLETSAPSEPEGALESTPADLEEALEPEEELTEEESNVSEADEAAATKKTILFLRAQAIDLEANPPKGKRIPAKQKQDLRAYRKSLKSSLSKAKTLSPSAVDDLESAFRTLSNRIQGDDKLEPAPTRGRVSEPQSDSLIEGNPKYPPMTSYDATSFTTDPTDPSNPLSYLFTLPDGRAPPLGPDGKPINPGPRWEPKDYMSAFAFIPRYLEVNQTIMSAVYLRHPVVRPGIAEVPSPFNFETHLLTFGWYLRRR